MYIFFQHKKNVVEMVDENKKLYIFIGKSNLKCERKIGIKWSFYFIFYFMYFTSYWLIFSGKNETYKLT